MDGSKESVCILSSPSIVLIDVGKNVTLRRTPKALQEAKNLGSLGVAVRARFSKERSQSATFNKSAVLSGDREET
jgi:hypothetical protein